MSMRSGQTNNQATNNANEKKENDNKKKKEKVEDVKIISKSIKKDNEIKKDDKYKMTDLSIYF